MSELDFTLELNSEQLPKTAEYDLYSEAESRLKTLAQDHDDLRGAAINIRRPASRESAHLYEVTVVVYGRPDNTAATQEETSPELALKEALDSIERQVRERRKRLKDRWKQPGNLPVEQEVIDVIAAEDGSEEENPG